jgi:hypothetical protein
MTIASIRSPLQISWELLPDDHPLPDDPVDNIDQPLLAEALRESLDLAHQLPSQGFVATNFGICTQVNDKFVIKAPDWVYIPRTESQRSRRRSYTPQREGDLPLIVMEFLSETEGANIQSILITPTANGIFTNEFCRFPITASLSQKGDDWKFIV